MNDDDPDTKTAWREAWRGVLGTLYSGRQLLADENNWCQQYALHPDGKRRSILGAVGNILYRAENEWTREATQLLAVAIGKGRDPFDGGWVQHFNDTHTHSEVLGLLDATITTAQAALENPTEPPRGWRDGALRARLIEP